jgi:putative membrane protein
VVSAGGASASPTWSDANILAVLDRANANDSAGGTLAHAAATNPQVRAYGDQMVADHHRLREQGRQLSAQVKLAPEPPPNDSLSAKATTQMQQLTGMPRGHAWDKAYIDGEVQMHQAVIATAAQARQQTQSPALKALIDRATPVLERHLARARAIQKTL